MMKKPELKPGYIAVAIVLIMAAVILLILITDANRNRREANIVLPEYSGDDGSGTVIELPYENTDLGEKVEINTGNVLSVIRAMERPEHYYLEMDTTVYAGEAFLTTGIRHWVSGEQSVTRRYKEGDAAAVYIMRTEENVKIWFEGSQDVYIGAVSDYSGDDAAAIPSYEDVLTTGDRILSAKYVTEDEYACIYVSAADEALSYVKEYYIDVNTGLLVKMQTRREGKLVYSMKVGIIDEDISSMDLLFGA